jgi:type I restriction-modification system DNA methylase subunit
VDAADFKTYIFPLLFFKRISDVYDEETQQALEESGGDEEYASFPEVHRFQIPAGCHWRDVRARTTNVGQALQNTRRVSSGPTRAHYTVFSAMRRGPIRSASLKKAGDFYTPRSDVEGVAQVVTLDEIGDNDWNLNIPRYVEPVIEEEMLTVEEAVQNLKLALNEAYAAEDRLKELLRDAGLM